MMSKDINNAANAAARKNFNTAKSFIFFDQSFLKSQENMRNLIFKRLNTELLKWN